MLRVGGRFFDPSGVISPLVIQVKLIFQNLCKSKTDWDDMVDVETAAKMNEFMRNLNEVKMISVPRYIGFEITKSVHDVELHGVSDSSQKAYAAVVYARFKCKDQFYSKLLCAKTKATPLKKISVPRLELLACLLLSKLMPAVKESLESIVKIQGLTYWSDSKICLHWIKTVKKNGFSG